MAETIEQVALVGRMWCYDRVRENALEVLRNSNLIGFPDADLERLRAAIRHGKSEFDNEVEALKISHAQVGAVLGQFSSQETLANW